MAESVGGKALAGNRRRMSFRCTGVKSPERAWDFCVPVFLTEASELIEYAARENGYRP